MSENYNLINTDTFHDFIKGCLDSIYRDYIPKCFFELLADIDVRLDNIGGYIFSEDDVIYIFDGVKVVFDSQGHSGHTADVIKYMMHHFTTWGDYFETYCM